MLTIAIKKNVKTAAEAAEAIGIVKNANKARKEPLRVILNGLGKVSITGNSTNPTRFQHPVAVAVAISMALNK